MISTPSSTGGRFDFDDGGMYVGGWQEGMSHGHGVCTGPRGHGEYAGAWVMGFETSGVYTWTSGSFFEGQWLQGRRHGLGVENKGHWLYRGEWTQGYKGRYGTRQSRMSGAMFEGTWTSGMQDGYGVETYADGGTYQGQWMRGVRHGYGVRQSVSYDLAVRYRNSPNINQPLPAASTLTLPGSDKELESVLRERDRRLEESRGGFVLQANTLPDDNTSGRHQRLLLDKHGKPSLRMTIVKELKLVRQKTAGESQVISINDYSRSASHVSGGSVRSTSSTASQSSGASGATTVSVYSDEGDGNSFISLTDIGGVQENLVERYLGEWKSDKRSGYGVCERSDGVRYEGEWINNRKYGYGVTTLRDGTRVEGKYKNNVLISSGKNSKLFAMRSSKLRDRVEAAALAAHRAADIAKQKAEVAYARMTSARTKADEAQMAARRAVADAEQARGRARQYSPESSQPGTKLIANRLQEDQLLADYEDGADSVSSLHSPSRSSASSRFSSLFRSKKPPSDTSRYLTSQQEQHYDRGGGASSYHDREETFMESSDATRSYSAPPRRLPSYANGPITRAQPIVNADVAYNNDSRFRGSPDVSRGYQSRFNPPGGVLYGNEGQPYDGRGGDTTRGVAGGGGHNYGPQQFARPNGNEYTTNRGRDLAPKWSNNSVSQSEWQNNFDESEGGFDDFFHDGNPAHLSDPNSVRGGARYDMQLQQQDSLQQQIRRPDPGQPAYQDQTYMYSGGQQTPSLQQYMYSGGQQTPSLQQSSDYNPYNDAYNASDYGTTSNRERRKTLPSIIKEPLPLVTAASTMTSSAGLSGTTTTTTLPTTVSSSKRAKEEAARLVREEQVQQEIRRRRNVDTFVIEDGVRKRVKSFYAADDQNLGTGGVSKGLIAKSGDEEGYLPKLYRMESLRKADMGSVPDVSAAAKKNVEIMPREVVYLMSQQRREDLIRERREEEQRRKNQIVLRFGDIKDWCERRKLLLLVILINIGFGYLFYNMLN